MPLAAGDTVRSSVAPGWVAETARNAAVPSSGGVTAETVLQSVTFTAVAAARYKITALQSIQSSVAGDLIRVRIRWTTGASPSTGGTEILSQMPNADIASKGQVLPSTVTVQGLPAGQVTVAVTIARESGTGVVSSFGDARQTNTMLVERV